jgi:hypothetical protein
MALPEHPLSVTAVICEKVLHEKDGVMSAIRIVDVFTYTLKPELPTEDQGVKMVLLLGFKLPSGDTSEHSIALELLKPNGDRTAIEQPLKGVATSTFPDTPKGYNVIANLSVAPVQKGTHYFIVRFDGEELLWVPFTLLPKDDGSQE